MVNHQRVRTIEDLGNLIGLGFQIEFKKHRARWAINNAAFLAMVGYLALSGQPTLFDIDMTIVVLTMLLLNPVIDLIWCREVYVLDFAKFLARTEKQNTSSRVA